MTVFSCRSSINKVLVSDMVYMPNILSCGPVSIRLSGALYFPPHDAREHYVSVCCKQNSVDTAQTDHNGRNKMTIG